MSARERQAIAQHIERLAVVRTRADAERFLIRYGSRAVPALIEACSDDRPEIRFSAAWVLGHIGDIHAFDALVTLAGDPCEEVRYDAQWALGHLGDKRALPLLSAFVSTDPSGGAWYGLELFGSDAVPYLETMLDGSDEDLAIGAMDILAKVDPRRADLLLTPFLTHPNERLRIFAEDALETTRTLSETHNRRGGRGSN